jgi:monovalent cation:H+ antiporter-2, CPA2 family
VPEQPGPHGMQGIDFIQDLAVILAAAGILGWACQRVGLSVVVGFIAAGILVGPHTPPFAFVTDALRIEMAAQVGIVFLMFSIGLRLSLRRLRRLGLSLFVAVFAGAGIVYYLTRSFGAVAGFGGTESCSWLQCSWSPLRRSSAKSWRKPGRPMSGRVSWRWA